MSFFCGDVLRRFFLGGGGVWAILNIPLGCEIKGGFLLFLEGFLLGVIFLGLA